ncbi:MAG TPA: GMC oxidoreductase, partial [Steroidobacteraceae bacterium]|nr:GMC oxidoreductase [Steroidobacteraceae bacterium]
DPASDAPAAGVIDAASAPREEGVREVYAVPGYHAAATEDPPMSWLFSVRHYDNDQEQELDSKYDRTQDPSHGSVPTGASGEQPAKGGIQYPRSSALGGCTAHYAMIVVKPNDADWDEVAAKIGDPSWRSEQMQGYFARIEDCLYYNVYAGFFRKALFVVYEALRQIVGFINPRLLLDRGGHGSRGWQKTSFIDPLLIRRIASGDRTFLRVLTHVFGFLKSQPHRRLALWRALVKLQLVQLLDPNFGNARGAKDAQLSFIPIGTDGKRRTGLRERLLDVATRMPERLVLVAGALVVRVIFQSTKPGDTSSVPRAYGVEVAHGLQLYAAGHAQGTGRIASSAGVSRYYARCEIILAGGAFNTPQLLMLSGIGEAAHLAKHQIGGPRDGANIPVARVVNLPGVGRNLQDRYEVSVISRVSKPFTTLDKVSFRPGDPQDEALAQWRKTHDGLYATNGGSVAFFRNTNPSGRADPDLFVFGAPAAFRGYYWGWSRELLRGDPDPQKRKDPDPAMDERDLWSWILLKAYTSNNGGDVRLRSDSAFVQPEINFRSFAEGPAGYKGDLDALEKGVRFVRELNIHVAAFSEEIQPGKGIDTPDGLRKWIGKEAWGHHACGTCRMGTDPWMEDVEALKDGMAVLDSEFRVHGVRGLRVVDASVFPTIPGYFIVTPIFMISEKAADLLINDSKEYPERLRIAEAAAIMERRRVAEVASLTTGASASVTTPPNVVGLALSGGGVRSATFALGVLQALAQRGRLRGIDFLSTVSGGGYIGSFLGRLYTRVAPSVANPAARVESLLGKTGSAEIWWLRSHANYLYGEGRSDLETNLGVIWRNLLAVHACIGTLLFGIFALLRRIMGPGTVDCGQGWLAALGCSPWWSLPPLIVVGAVFPAWFGFWLAPRPGAQAAHPLWALGTWIVLLAGAIYTLRFPGAQGLASIAIVSLLLAWVWQELARWRMPKRANQQSDLSAVVRNRLTRGLGVALALLFAAVLWCVLDSYARGAAHELQLPVVGGMVLINVALPIVRLFLDRAGSVSSKVEKRVPQKLLRKVQVGAIAFGLAAFLAFALDVLAHTAMNVSTAVGTWALVFAFLVSFAVGRATGFVNLSSLQAFYASRLSRTYLGASNDARVHFSPTDTPPDVNTAHPDDDVAFEDYHPERRGGPLHLINVCVNETADAVSGRHLEQDKGLPMCVGAHGVSVGVRYHALWTDAAQAHVDRTDNMVRAYDNMSATPVHEQTALMALPVAPDPESFHVLAHVSGKPIAVEPLRLSQWMAISGAAFTTGSGRFTSLATSLLLGLLNVRLGYWWNTGVNAGKRPGRYPPTFINRLMGLPGFFFRSQQTLLNEWRGYFPGPAARMWNLSDGGHFENSGLYELIRRRVGFMIAVDADEDPKYGFDDLGLLVRRARLDFGANFTWVDPTGNRKNGQDPPHSGWAPVNQTVGGAGVPSWIQQWLNPDALGPMTGIARLGPFASALARIGYADSDEVSWLVVLKANLVTQDSALDLRCYASANEAFPNQPTVDQVFDDDQWESYRLLGEASGRNLFQ